MRLLPTKQGLLDNMWANLLMAGLVAIIGGVWSQREEMWPIASSVLFLVGVLAVAVAFGLLTARFLEHRSANAQEVAAIDFQEVKHSMAAAAEAAFQVAREQAPPDPPADFDDRPDPVTNEPMQRLREFYPFCQKAVVYAEEYFTVDICNAGVSSKEEANSLIVALLRQCIIPRYREVIKLVTDLMGNPGTRSRRDLASTVAAFQNLASEYVRVLDWIRTTGPLFIGRGRFLSSDGYRGLYERHRRYVEFQGILAGRTDIGNVAYALESSAEMLPVPVPSANSASPTSENRLRSERGGPTLEVTPLLDNLGGLWPIQHSPEERLRAGHLKRSFLVLEVTNNGTRNLNGVVALCRFEPVGIETEGVWSRESGKKSFVLGGRHISDLGAADSRRLVLAQAFGIDCLWLKVIEPIHSVPAGQREGPSRRQYFAPNGEDMVLGRKLEVLVQFAAHDFKQAVRYRLSFIGHEPRVELIPE